MKRKIVTWLLVGTLGVTMASNPVLAQADETIDNTSTDEVTEDETEQFMNNSEMNLENANVQNENATEDINIDSISFPDEVFRQYVLDNLDLDKNQKLSDAEASNVIALDLNENEENTDIADLSGIEYFTELTTLDCQNTQIVTLDLTANTKLERLNITGNQLLAVDVSQCSSLTTMECQDNHLTQIDLVNNMQLTDGSYADQTINDNKFNEWYLDEALTQKVNNTGDISEVAGQKVFLDAKITDEVSEQDEIVEDNSKELDSSNDPGLSDNYEDIQNSTAASGKAMYRMYNSHSGEHFYTASTSEREHLRVVGWNYEGIAWYAPSTSSAPVYRLYNPNAGDHHYTTGIKERQMLVAVGWKYEGIGWYSQTAKTVVLYRLYNPNAKGAGAHHYTTSAGEKNSLVRIGWRYEGIGWYAVAAGSGSQSNSSAEIKKAKAAYASFLNNNRSSYGYFQLINVKGSSVPLLVVAQTVQNMYGKNAATNYTMYLYKNGSVTRLDTFANNGGYSYLTLANQNMGAAFRMGMRVLNIQSGHLSGDVVYEYRFNDGHQGKYYKYYSSYTESAFQSNLTWSKMTLISEARYNQIVGDYYPNSSGSNLVNFVSNTYSNVASICG